MDDATLTLCINVVRAAIARTISERQQLPFADHQKAQLNDLVGQAHLALVNFDHLGYPMGDSLVPLALMSGQQDSVEEDTPETGITTVDQMMAATNADLHNRLLNLSPQFKQYVSVDFSNSTLSKVYGNMLQTSEFAGHIEGQGVALADARNLIFPEDNAGIPRKSQVYKLYEEYEARISQLIIELDAARLDGRTDTVSVLQHQLDRVEAEWITLGQKNRVEHALKVILKADADAGFEDERNQFIDAFEASKRVSISGVDYAAVKIHPLSTLLDVSNSLWLKVSLDKLAVKKLFDTETLTRFNLSSEQVEQALPFISSVTFEYTTIFLGREWLQDDFLHAGYWRQPDNKIMSDGKGGGLSPTVASLAIFSKNAVLELTSDISASEGNSGIIPTTNKRLIMHKMVATPLLNNLSKPDVNAKLNAKITAVRARKISTLLNTNKVEIARFNILRTPLITPPLIAAPLIPRPIPPIILRPDLRIPPGRDRERLPPQGPGHVSTVRRKVKVDGQIKLTGNIGISDLKTRIKFSWSDGTHESIPLKKEETNKLTFSYKKNMQLVGTQSEVFVQLVDTNENLLIERRIALDRANIQEKIIWSVTHTTTELELCSRTSPTLTGYGLKILPKCPNPADNFVWE